MTTEEWSYLYQGVNYLGFLETKLRDLRGIATLVYELIQNADDVKDEEGQPGASLISFDIREDALIVENDGAFRELDFQRMQDVASGDKREEEGTTGAFGIGFITVYQITDYPELFSSDRHWIIRPDEQADRRIKQRSVRTTGTRFRLPWAFDPNSKVRRELRIEAIRPEQLSDFEQEMGQALSLAALFLKQLKVLELKREGKLVKRIEREVVADEQIQIRDGDQTAVWHIFRGSFQAEAERLRRSYSHIEAKKRSEVLVAIPDEGLEAGQLFAVLPSRTSIPLPFHINADFFPSSDRTQIIFGTDYQSEWNRAAVRAAAQALAGGLDRLPQLLGHEGLWRLLRSLYECDREATQGKHDPVFASFWKEVAPGLSTRPIVFTTTDRWVKPGEARLLESNAEQEAASILEGLGIQIVHPELRPFRNLLRQKEIGAPLLNVQDVAQGLKRVGLNTRTPLDKAPSHLRTEEAWQKLWRALDALLVRLPLNERELANGMLGASVIALGDDGALWPPTQLFGGDAETRALFRGVPWLEEHVESDGVPGRLVPAFTAGRAIGFLSGLAAEELEAACHEGELDVRALYRWFEGHKTEVTSSQELMTRLRALPIWPVAGEFRPLEGLFIPGGFDDPLHLSALVEVDALGGRKEFLKDLGVPELTFHVYAREQVPRVLKEQPDLPAEARRKLVQLLAQRLGEIRDDWQLQRRLRNLNLVECTDGGFRPAHQAYLQSDVVKILGGRVHVAAELAQNAEAVTALYRWLEVAEEPRPEDVLERVREFAQGPVSEEAKEAVETVFEYLVNGWIKWDEMQKQRYALLQNLAWLPGTKDQRQWHRPEDLYASFQYHLFETQASFLDFPLQLQRQAAGQVRLIEFLGIKPSPSPGLVVGHLLTCSEQGKKVPNDVYSFLNNNADDLALNRLKGRACLLLPNGTYVRPDQVYWGEHPFGPFRHQLGPELRTYNALFKRLGVQERPGIQDFIKVLIEISERFEGHKVSLDEQTDAVLMRCWEALSAALEREEISAASLAELKRHRVIPDARRMLNLAQYMFFEDRAGLATKFPQFLENSVILRPQGAWQAMAAVGVRLLGQAVEVHLVEPPDSIEDAELASRVRERRLLIDRVIESEKASGTDDLDVTALDGLHFERASALVIQYSLEAFRQKRTTDPESVPALLMPEEPTLYVVYENAHPSWPAVARELAHAIKPVGEIGGLAGGIKEALANGSFGEASRTLNALGYPPLEQRKEIEVSESGAITDFGGTEAPDGDETGYEPPVEQVETEEPESGVGVGTLSPEEALRAILNGQEPPRTPMPPSEPERPAGTGTPDDGGRGSDGTEAGDGRPAKPGRVGGRRRQKRKPRGKLRSYVMHDDNGDKDDADTTGARHRNEVSQAGVERVLAYESACGRTPKEMPYYHKGYDVESLEAEGSVRYIEVKSLSGEWGTRNAAGLTRAQFETARKQGEQFWLYVVERASEDEARIYPIQDPANRVNQFLYDGGWEALAEVEKEWNSEYGPKG